MVGAVAAQAAAAASMTATGDDTTAGPLVDENGGSGGSGSDGQQEAGDGTDSAPAAAPPATGGTTSTWSAADARHAAAHAEASASETQITSADADAAADDDENDNGSDDDNNDDNDGDDGGGHDHAGTTASGSGNDDDNGDRIIRASDGRSADGACSSEAAAAAASEAEAEVSEEGDGDGEVDDNEQQQQQRGDPLPAVVLTAMATTAEIFAAHAAAASTAMEDAQEAWAARAVEAAAEAAAQAASTVATEAVVLPSELRDVLEEVATTGRSTRLPWTEEGEEEEEVLVIPPPFSGLVGDRRPRKRKRGRGVASSSSSSLLHGSGNNANDNDNNKNNSAGTASRSTRSMEADAGADAENTVCDDSDNDSTRNEEGPGRKRPRPLPNNSKGRDEIDCVVTPYEEEEEKRRGDDSGAAAATTATAIASRSTPPQFRSLRDVIRVSLALVLDDAYEVCSERYGVGYRTGQAEREEWDRRRRMAARRGGDGDGKADEAIENGSSSGGGGGGGGEGPARPQYAQDDEEGKFLAACRSGNNPPAEQISKETYIDRRTRLIAMLGDDAHSEAQSSSSAVKKPSASSPLPFPVVEPPFTIQRICEILLSPTKYYSQTHKLCNALEKLLLITTPEGAFGSVGGEADVGRYEANPIPEEEELDLRMLASRESPLKSSSAIGRDEELNDAVGGGGGFMATGLLQVQELSMSSEQSEQYRRHRQEHKQNQTSALVSAAASGLTDRFAFTSSSGESPDSGQVTSNTERSSMASFGASSGQLMNVRGNDHSDFGTGEHLGADASTLDARSEQELRQHISSSLEGGGSASAPGNLIARAPSPVLFANSSNPAGGLPQAPTEPAVMGLRKGALNDAVHRPANGNVDGPLSSSSSSHRLEIAVGTTSRGSPERPEKNLHDASASAQEKDAHVTGDLSASNSEDDVDDSMESGDDLSIDDSASDRSDRSDRSDGADSDSGSHNPNVSAGAAASAGSGLAVAAMGVSSQHSAVDPTAPYGYEPFAAARVMALNRIHQQQQQQRQEQFLQSRALASVGAGAHAAGGAVLPPGGAQHGGVGVGLSSSHHHQDLNFRPPPDSEYQSGDSIDSMRAEDSCGSDSSASDMND
eukprot:CAMPEP_0178635232 /NCGR_PEP_ID=MMETSP0698-20121128/13054_1 /TAXON_ID=265572 /ORGANISM="Extubocellulus spinifer, Strain CCMP396" /LENGTH=1107 /DNA_ID=CAMNT_0020274953 /DNA_START=373 /DNA_END=3696 /DNA_ORIENTATION=+